MKQLSTALDIAGIIDHTILKPDSTAADVQKICAEARRYHFASVCVNPYWVPLAAFELRDSAVKVCAVAGFPLGANTTVIKVAEAVQATRDGAREIDMVLNIGEFLSGNDAAAGSDIRAVAEAAHAGGAVLKVILETALLNDDQKVRACELAKIAGADFVKTSTGFGPGGATAADVVLMRRTVGPDMGVKAAGGIRTLEDLQAMVDAGANRIGASASVKIIQSVTV